MSFEHISVLLEESLSGLNIRPGLSYIDATTGGAGHSKEIAKKMKGGRLFCFDKDPDAIKVAKKRLAEYDFITFCETDFSQMKTVIENNNIEKVDGILMDLGVSSHQIDTKERGFSFHQDAPLDMRMSQKGVSAFDIVNNFDESQLTNILFRYGEEKYARSIARVVVKKREEKQIETTLELLEIIKSGVPSSYKRKGNPGRKTFQAIRIAVNNELDNLENVVKMAVGILNKGGRLAIISFHSLEDRIVKHAMRDFTIGCICPPESPICICDNKPTGKVLNKKPIIPSKEELENNPRSKSAKLRIFEKIV